jgi:hypothetical protein
MCCPRGIHHGDFRGCVGGVYHNKRVNGWYELHRCVERRGEQGGFLRRVAWQVLPLTRLGEGAQALDAPVDKFRDWQEIGN